MAKTFWADCSVSPRYNEDTAKYLAEQWRVSLRAETEANTKKPGLQIENILGIAARLSGDNE